MTANPYGKRPQLAPDSSRQKTDRDKLIECIQLAEKHGWTQTLEQLGETLFALECGKIERAF